MSENPELLEKPPPPLLHVLLQELACVCSIRNQQEAFSSSSETSPEVGIPTQKLDGTTVNHRLAIFSGCSLPQHRANAVHYAVTLPSILVSSTSIHIATMLTIRKCVVIA